MNIAADKLRQRFTPKPLKVLETKRQLYVIRFSPCGKFLLAGGYDGLVHRWDVSSDKLPELPPVNGHGGWVCGLAFHPLDKRHVFTADSWGQVRAWAYGEEKPLAKWSVDNAHDGWIRDLAVSRDGNLVAACGMDRRVRVWSSTDGKRLHEFAHSEDLFSVAMHPDGKSLIAGDLKGAVSQWDLASGREVRTLDAKLLYKLDRLQDVGGVWRLVFDDKGETLAAAGCKPSVGATVQGIPTVLLFDWATGKQKLAMALGDNSDVLTHDVAFHPAGFVMAVTSGQPGRGKVVFWRPGEAKPFYESNTIENCHSLSLHPDGRRLAVSGTSRGSNGNGRVLVNGQYVGNTSPIHLLQFAGT
jgi:WD40 repeat protein